MFSANLGRPVARSGLRQAEVMIHDDDDEVTKKKLYTFINAKYKEI